MSTHTALPEAPTSPNPQTGRPLARGRRGSYSPRPTRFPAYPHDMDASTRQAELFYLQKQIQSQTQMVIILEDGERLEGCIEWYDRNSLKVRGHGKTLIYKSAIKYMFKHGDIGQ